MPSEATLPRSRLGIGTPARDGLPGRIVVGHGVQVAETHAATIRAIEQATDLPGQPLAELEEIARSAPDA